MTKCKDCGIDLIAEKIVLNGRCMSCDIINTKKLREKLREHNMLL